MKLRLPISHTYSVESEPADFSHIRFLLFPLAFMTLKD